jgi:hypothetical protein
MGLPLLHQLKYLIHSHHQDFQSKKTHIMDQRDSVGFQVLVNLPLTNEMISLLHRRQQEFGYFTHQYLLGKTLPMLVLVWQ